ncbi:hypothetical protein B0H10DRAFT_1945612 [Mycena sp. CBHHK59/15]|nr:hypothetical protein B0H10DRAFT_1945612 [Mycena sp. CBHHK59/15]
MDSDRLHHQNFLAQQSQASQRYNPRGHDDDYRAPPSPRSSDSAPLQSHTHTSTDREALPEVQLKIALVQQATALQTLQLLSEVKQICGSFRATTNIVFTKDQQAEVTAACKLQIFDGRRIEFDNEAIKADVMLICVLAIPQKNTRSLMGSTVSLRRRLIHKDAHGYGSTRRVSGSGPTGTGHGLRPLSTRRYRVPDPRYYGCSTISDAKAMPPMSAILIWPVALLLHSQDPTMSTLDLDLPYPEIDPRHDLQPKNKDGALDHFIDATVIVSFRDQYHT